MPGPSFKTKNMLSIPKQVELAQLRPNGKVYSDQIIEQIKTLNLPEGRTTKRDLLKQLNEKFPQQHYQSKDIDFSIERHADNYNAIYKGKSRDFFVLEDLPENNLKKYINSYLFSLHPEALFYVDSEARLQQLEIHDAAKFELLMLDFREDFIEKDAPLRKQLVESPAIAQDIVDLIAENPGHERIKAGDLSLGSGKFGSVKLTQDLTSGDWNVIKVIKNESDKESLHAEIRNLQKINQFESAYQRANMKDEIQNEIVMKRAKGVELFKMAYSGMKLPTSGWIDISINMLKALNDIHKNGIIHRDIKCENMLCDPISKAVTLVDFGLAVATDNIVTGIKDNAGSPLSTYFAPESDSEGIYNEKTEVYAMGIAIANMFGLTEESLHPVFAKRSHPNFTDNTKIPDPETREAILTQLEKMTAEDPSTRPAVEECIQLISEIREKYLDASALTVESAYMDVNQFEKADPAEKSAMIDKLLQLNEVWLIDLNADSHNLLYYENIKRQLAERGINVSEEIIQPLTNNIQQVMKEYAGQRALANHLIYNYSHVSSSAELVNTTVSTMETSHRATSTGLIFSGLQTQNEKNPLLASLIETSVTKDEIREALGSRSAYEAPRIESDAENVNKDEALSTPHYVPPTHS